MSLLLYAATATVLLVLCHRFVEPLSPGVAALLLLLPFCFTGRALLTGGVYTPVDLPFATSPLAGLKTDVGVGDPHDVMHSDLYTQVIPWRQAMRMSIGRGQWPLWNPFIFSGDVLAAAAQPAAYSPSSSPSRRGKDGVRIWTAAASNCRSPIVRFSRFTFRGEDTKSGSCICRSRSSWEGE